MKKFSLHALPPDLTALTRALENACAGACVYFEGKVRDHNAGRAVVRLEYQAYAPLAEAEGERILTEAMHKFAISNTLCMHRTGLLEIGDVAVWVGVSAAHRAAAFDACRYIIDEVKLRVPIWKNEHYADGASGWLHPDNTPVS